MRCRKPQIKEELKEAIEIEWTNISQKQINDVVLNSKKDIIAGMPKAPWAQNRPSVVAWVDFAETGLGNR